MIGAVIDIQSRLDQINAFAKLVCMSGLESVSYNGINPATKVPNYRRLANGFDPAALYEMLAADGGVALTFGKFDEGKGPEAVYPGLKDRRYNTEIFALDVDSAEGVEFVEDLLIKHKYVNSKGELSAVMRIGGKGKHYYFINSLELECPRSQYQPRANQAGKSDVELFGGHGKGWQLMLPGSVKNGMLYTFKVTTDDETLPVLSKELWEALYVEVSKPRTGIAAVTLAAVSNKVKDKYQWKEARTRNPVGFMSWFDKNSPALTLTDGRNQYLWDTVVYARDYIRNKSLSRQEKIDFVSAHGMQEFDRCNQVGPVKDGSFTLEQMLEQIDKAISGGQCFDEQQQQDSKVNLELIAQKTLEQLGENIIFPDNSLKNTNVEFYRFNGVHWEARKGTEVVDRDIRKVWLDLYGENHPKWGMKVVREVYGTMRLDFDGDRSLEMFKHKAHPDRHYLNFNNGVMDVSTYAKAIHAYRNHGGRSDSLLEAQSAFSAPTPDFQVLSVRPYDVNPLAVCPIWTKNVEDRFPNPATRREYQKFMGTILVASNKYKKHAVLYGAGNSGKTTMSNFFRQVFVDTSDVSLAGLAPSDRFSRISLKGSLVNMVSDMDSKTGSDYGNSHAQVDWGLFKKVHSTDAWQAEEKGKQVETVVSFAKWIYSCNSVPAFPKRDNEVWLRLLTFPVTQVTNIDPNFGDKLAKEIPGFINWCAEGLGMLIEDREKFSPTPEMLELENKWRHDGDPILSWFNDGLVVTGNQDDVHIYEDHHLIKQFGKEHAAGFANAGYTFGYGHASLKDHYQRTVNGKCPGMAKILELIQSHYPAIKVTERRSVIVDFDKTHRTQVAGVTHAPSYCFPSKITVLVGVKPITSANVEELFPQDNAANEAAGLRALDEARQQAQQSYDMVRGVVEWDGMLDDVTFDLSDPHHLGGK